MPFSAEETRAAFLACQFLSSLSAPLDDLSVAVEALETTFQFSVEADAAKFNPTSLSLLDLIPAVPQATESSSSNNDGDDDAGEAALEAQEDKEIDGLASIRDFPKFQKYLATVKAKGFFKGVDQGTPTYNTRLGKLVAKFRSSFAADVAKHEAASAGSSTERADELKNEGNNRLKQRDFRGAIESYSNAIDLDPTGPNAHVYFGNRAAARQHLKDFAGAAEDCRSSIRVNPKYGKSHTRLASALHNLGQYSGAIKACQDALALDETNSTAATYLAKAQRAFDAHGDQAASSMQEAAPQQPAASAGGMPDLSGLMGALGGGQMPDLGAMMQNPMMQNAMKSMMENPEMMKNMMGAVGGMMGKGGAPDMSKISQMAAQLGINPGAAGAPGAAEVEEVEGDDAEEVN